MRNVLAIIKKIATKKKSKVTVRIWGGGRKSVLSLCLC